MRYVDGFVLPVPKKNLRVYRQMAQQAGKVWRKYGAVAYRLRITEWVRTGRSKRC